MNYPMFGYNPYPGGPSPYNGLQNQQITQPNSYPNYPPNNPPSVQTIQAIPVTCIEEARAARIALDGSISVFVNIKGNEIYTKQLNNSGIAELTVYQKLQENLQSPQYVSIEQFENLCKKVNSLENMIGGKSNVQSTNVQPSNNAVAQHSKK